MPRSGRSFCKATPTISKKFEKSRFFFGRILDEEEIFEKETPFSNKELESICKYVNIFCFRSIWSGAVGM